MLEYGLTELDNDFITVWSRYLLTGDSQYVIKDIECLAKLGQINAIQSWYLFKNEGDNLDIDKYVDEIGDSYNALLVKARIQVKYPMQQEIVNNNYQYVNDKDYIPLARGGYYELTEKGRTAREKINDLEFCKLYRRAIGEAWETGYKTNNLITLGIAADIACEYIDAHKINQEDYDLFKRTYKSRKIICKELLKEFKKNKKCVASFDPLSEPEKAFTLAKNIIEIDDKSKKNFATNLLKELSKREYCDELKNALETAKVPNVNR